MNFALSMAWRDFRARPSRFILYVLAIALGVGSLAAIDSLRHHVHDAIHAQGRNLLGADLHLRSRRPFTAGQEALLSGWPGRSVRSISYRTVLLEPRGGGTRLVEVEAAGEGFPFYGGIDTEPVSASTSYFADGQVLLDQVLLLQLGIVPGMDVRVGGQPFTVAGAVRQSPGEVPARSMIAPKVYLPYHLVDEQRMRSPGTMASFEWYGALPAGAPDILVHGFASEARRAGFDVETVDSRREQLLGSTDRMGRYLGLVGLTALLIGCLGVAGAVHFFIDSKRMAVAQLRCIGATLYQASAMFLVQLAVVALAGATAGLGVGWVTANALPGWLEVFLPIPVTGGLHPWSMAAAWAVGMVFTLLSGLLPVLRLRRIHPIDSLRVHAGPAEARWDVAGLLLLGLLVLVLVAFGSYQLGSWRQSALYLGGVALVLGLLAVTGYGMRALCRQAVRPGWSYTVRLAVSGMYRPQNQTGLLVAGLGLGFFLLNAVDVLEQHVVRDFELTGKARPNLAMIDIQPDQREPLLAELDNYDSAVTYVEPMVTMRLVGINGKAIRDIEAEPGSSRPNWALKREYRTTYRAHRKPDIERVVAGTWIDRPFSEGIAGRVPVSLEEGIAEALQVGLGDTLTFDVHGLTVTTRVANLREVDWKSMQPNFFLLFPPGVLEGAPQTFLVFSQMDDLVQRASFQRALADRFPNVTVIDISLMLDTVARMTEQLAAAIRAMAWFTMAAGFLVLVAILRAGAAQRQRERVLLRTMGASRRVVAGRQMIEYLVLALVAMVSGLVLSWAAMWGVVRLGMKLPYDPDWGSPWPTMASLLTVIVALGWINAQSALRQQPAQAWRSLSIMSN